MNPPSIYSIQSTPPPLVPDDMDEKKILSSDPFEDLRESGLESEEFNESPINLLPDEVLVLIFERLPLSALPSTAGTSKNWKKIIFDRSTLKGLISHLMPQTFNRIEAKRLLRDRVARAGKNKRRVVESDYLHYLKTEAGMRSSAEPPECKELQGHTKGVFCLKTTEDGTLVSGSADGTVRMWSLESDEPTILTLNDSILDMQIEEDNFYFRGSSHQVHVLSRNKEAAENSILTPGFPVSSFQVLGDLIYYGSESGSIQVFDINSHQTIASLKSGNNTSVASLFVNDRVYAGFSDGSLKAFDIESGSVIQNFKGHHGMIKSFSVLDNRIYSGSYDGSICTWDVRSNLPVSVISFEDPISCLDVIDNKIGSGCWDGFIRYFDMRSSKLLKTLEHTICVMSLHSNEGIIYSGSMGQIIRLWDFNT